MELINKPIQKGTVTEFIRSPKAVSLASALLTGALALTASGCTTEVKADGITVENLYISGTEETGMISDALINPVNITVDESMNETVPSGIKKADPVSPEIKGSGTVNTVNMDLKELGH